MLTTLLIVLLLLSSLLCSLHRITRVIRYFRLLLGYFGFILRRWVRSTWTFYVITENELLRHIPQIITASGIGCNDRGPLVCRNYCCYRRSRARIIGNIVILVSLVIPLIVRRSNGLRCRRCYFVRDLFITLILRLFSP